MRETHEGTAKRESGDIRLRDSGGFSRGAVDWVSIEEVGAAFTSTGDTLFALPAFDVGMVAAQQNRGHWPAVVFGRPGVLRVLEEAIGEGLLLGRSFIAERARDVPGDSIDEDHRRELAAGKDVIADRDFPVDTVVDEALIDAFVAAADEDQAGMGGELSYEAVG